MNIPINKVGNIEINSNLLKFRMPITEFNTTDVGEIEKNLKRKVIEIQTVPYYLIPSQIESINSSVIFYYQVDNYKSFDYIRQLTFGEKLKYFSSLVEIAKRQEQTKVLWNRFNFVLDPLEEKFKAVVYETENMKIHEQTDEFAGIKELILLGLTRLERIYGKPSRADFIDQDEYVIHFAETLLKIEEIEDLDHFINTKVIEFEHGGLDQSNIPVEEEKDNTSKKFNLMLPKFNKPKKQNNPVSRSNGKSKKTGKDDKLNKLIFIFSGVLIVAFLVTKILPSGEGQALENDEKKQVITSSSEEYKTEETTSSESNTVTDKKYHEKLLEAYRLSLTGSNEKAVGLLEEIGYDNLSVQDQNILLTIYQNSNLIHKVIDLKPERSKEIINELIANGKEKEIETIKELMETSNPYVDFEVSYLKENWQHVIDLKDQVDLNGRKEQQIVNAYIQLELYDDGIIFAEKVGNPELLEMVKNYAE